MPVGRVTGRHRHFVARFVYLRKLRFKKAKVASKAKVIDVHEQGAADAAASSMDTSPEDAAVTRASATATAAVDDADSTAPDKCSHQERIQREMSELEAKCRENQAEKHRLFTQLKRVLRLSKIKAHLKANARIQKPMEAASAAPSRDGPSATPLSSMLQQTHPSPAASPTGPYPAQSPEPAASDYQHPSRLSASNSPGEDPDKDKASYGVATARAYNAASATRPSPQRERMLPHRHSYLQSGRMQQHLQQQSQLTRQHAMSQHPRQYYMQGGGQPQHQGHQRIGYPQSSAAPKPPIHLFSRRAGPPTQHDNRRPHSYLMQGTKRQRTRMYDRSSSPSYDGNSVSRRAAPPRSSQAMTPLSPPGPNTPPPTTPTGATSSVQGREQIRYWPVFADDDGAPQIAGASHRGRGPRGRGGTRRRGQNWRQADRRPPASIAMHPSRDRRRQW